MTRLNRITASVLLAIATTSTACQDGSAPPQLGPLTGAIVKGQNQIVVAGDACPNNSPVAPFFARCLPEPIVEELVRAPLTGQLHLRRVDPQRLLDLVVPRAYAQTVVRGSPVPGAVVCAEEGVALVPFARCTNTGTDGMATFFFSPGTVAGDHTSEIRGSLDGQPAVFDTVRATVRPAAPDPNYRTETTPLRCSPATFPANGVRDRFGNGVGYRIITDGRLTVEDTTTGSTGARTVTFDASLIDATDQNRVVELRGAGGVQIAKMRYRVRTSSGACAGDAPYIDWSAAGMSQTP